MRKILLLPVILFFGTNTMAQQFNARYELVNLGKEINTHYHEAAPIISIDGKTLYFFVHNHPQNTYGTEGSDDIWSSSLDANGKWLAPTHLGSPFNVHRSNQVFTALPDGSLVIRGGKTNNSKGFSIIKNGSLTELKIPNFDDMNKGRFYGASMSSDGQHLVIYMSEVAATVRSSLYITHLQGGSWSLPKRLSISTRSDDFGPFIGPDDQFLYFASDRKAEGKQGGVDIYRSKRMDATWDQWGEPVNLGPVINTRAADSYFCIDKSNNVFVSRANSTIDGGNLDLFVLVPRDIKVFISGRVYDQQTSLPLRTDIDILPLDSSPIATRASADGNYKMRVPEVEKYTLKTSLKDYYSMEMQVSLPTLMNDTTVVVDFPLVPVPKKLVLNGTVYDFKTNEPINATVQVQLRPVGDWNKKLTATSGKFSQVIDQEGIYRLTASAEGYLNSTDSLEIMSIDGGQVTKDLYLNPIEVGMTVRLNNIYFDSDKTTLKSQSFVELDKVVEFMTQNPTIEIEIAGHTDSQGSDDYNINLSQGRAQAVVDYVASKGIDSFRMSAHGYGESKPVDTNDTDEGRAVNRRVEFTVLKK